MDKQRGTGLIMTGLLMVMAALFFVFYNLYVDHRAGQNLVTVPTPKPAAVPVEETYSGKTMVQPDISVEMPVVTINGQDYIGTLEIPVLELSLGIISLWSPERLQVAPCRYTGSLYTDDLVLAGHNYSTHFGKLKDLQPGDRVLFTDVDGKTTAYLVTLQEILMPEDVEEMTDGRWDLTLFTCTLGGGSRVTVRCDRERKDMHEYAHEEMSK